MPEIAESTFVFDGAQVQKDNKGLGVTNGASGTLNNLELSLSQQVNGSASSKQLDAVIVQGGDVNFAGDVLNLSVVTDFKGTGNNHVTAFNVDNSKAKVTISAERVSLSAISKAKDGKAVYGLSVAGDV